MDDQPKIVTGEIRTFDEDTMRDIEATDPVMGFCRRVADRAVAKPYWSEDFRRATYDALAEECSLYMSEHHSHRAKTI